MTTKLQIIASAKYYCLIFFSGIWLFNKFALRAIYDLMFAIRYGFYLWLRFAVNKTNHLSLDILHWNRSHFACSSKEQFSKTICVNKTEIGMVDVDIFETQYSIFTFSDRQTCRKIECLNWTTRPTASIFDQTKFHNDTNLSDCFRKS